MVKIDDHSRQNPAYRAAHTTLLTLASVSVFLCFIQNIEFALANSRAERGERKRTNTIRASAHPAWKAFYVIEELQSNFVYYIKNFLLIAINRE